MDDKPTPIDPQTEAVNNALKTYDRAQARRDGCPDATDGTAAVVLEATSNGKNAVDAVLALTAEGIATINAIDEGRCELRPGFNNIRQAFSTIRQTFQHIEELMQAIEKLLRPLRSNSCCPPTEEVQQSRQAAVEASLDRTERLAKEYWDRDCGVPEVVEALCDVFRTMLGELPGVEGPEVWD